MSAKPATKCMQTTSGISPRRPGSRGEPGTRIGTVADEPRSSRIWMRSALSGDDERRNGVLRLPP
jgi:hypothetical protein